MFCPQCGGTIKDGDAFCSACGYRSANVPQMQPPLQYQTPPQAGMYQVPPVQPWPPTPVLPGSKMLKVCSILYIVLGALSIIVSLAMASSVHGTFTTGGIIALILLDGGSIVCGIIGLRLCTHPSAAAFFIAVGFAFIPLYLFFIAYGGGISLGLGFIVLIILYIVGGFKLKKAKVPA